MKNLRIIVFIISTSSLDIALIKNNAAVGAQIAVQLSTIMNPKKSISKLLDEQKVIIIGGSNVDIVGKPTNKFLTKTSNPGVADVSIGGVGRNIFECVQRLGLKSSEFITFIGDDIAGKLILSDFKAKQLVIPIFMQQSHHINKFSLQMEL